METLTAFIPARGGSKGIPNKNIKEFAGKPLIVHSIEYALNCSQIDEVVVSTDDDKIAENKTIVIKTHPYKETIISKIY